MSTAIPLPPVYDFVALPLPVSVKVVESEIATLVNTTDSYSEDHCSKRGWETEHSTTSWFSLVCKISRKDILPSHQTGVGVAQPV